MELASPMAPSVTLLGSATPPPLARERGTDALPPSRAAGGLSTAQQATGGASEADARKKIDKTARDFEASFLSVMLGQMFSGVEVSAPFGGGQGEQMFRSFLTDAMSRSLADHGGIGVSGAIRSELLKLQGLN